MSDLETTQSHDIWVRDVTRDAVRHYAWGTGDNNPLWLDPEHARQTRYRTLLAPPCFCYALHETTVAPGFDGRQRIYQSVDWQWFDVIRLKTQLTPVTKLRDSATDSHRPTQVGSIDFQNRHGQIVARATTHCFRPAGHIAFARGREETKYSQTELAQIERSILSESRRGGEPRLWESTAPGDNLGPLTKGPLSIMDIVAWCAGTLGVSSDASEVSNGGLVEEVATGPQIAAWCAQLLTDWIGDHGFLQRMRVQVAEQPGLGSTTALHGTITHCWKKQSQHLAQVQLTALSRNQDAIATGTAIVALPTRDQPVHLPITNTANFRET